MYTGVQFQSLFVKFVTRYEEIHDLYLRMFNAPILDKLIFPLEVVKEYDNDDFWHLTCTAYFNEIILFTETFKNGYKERLRNIFESRAIRKRFMDTGSVIWEDGYGVLDFFHTEYVEGKRMDFQQQIYLPHIDNRHTDYGFWMPLLGENKDNINKENTLILLEQQIECANPIFMSAAFLMETNTFDGFYRFHDKLEKLKLTLSCGTDVFPFVEWINYFTFELWEKVGSDRQKIIKEYCQTIEWKTGIVTILTDEFLFLSEPNHLKLVNELNQKLGFGEIVKRDEPQIKFLSDR
jgi:hypothetical protein